MLFMINKDYLSCQDDKRNKLQDAVKEHFQDERLIMSRIDIVKSG